MQLQCVHMGSTFAEVHVEKHSGSDDRGDQQQTDDTADSDESGSTVGRL